VQSVLLENGSKKVDFENCGKIVSPSDFETVARTPEEFHTHF